MPNAFPYLGSYGGSDETDYPGVIRDYDDNTEREYYKTTAKKRTIELPLTNLSKTKRDAIETFYNANKKLDIYLYVWPEATAADPSGAATTGRHTARIRSALVFRNKGSCSYDTTLTFKLKD
jgi:hypothetical protein